MSAAVGKNSQLFSEPCDRFLPAARFLFQTTGCLCSGDRYRKYTLASLIEDSPYTYSDGTPVNNWDGKYIGQATVRYAILHSMNVCAVRTLTDIGIDTGMKYLENFGFTTLVSKEDDPAHNDYNQSTALGGITNGVYNIELTAAYAALANNGVYTKPILYTKVWIMTAMSFWTTVLLRLIRL